MRPSYKARRKLMLSLDRKLNSSKSRQNIATTDPNTLRVKKPRMSNSAPYLINLMMQMST